MKKKILYFRTLKFLMHLNLKRRNYTGQQKYGTILWSGDISANWKTLKNQIPEGLNICASGMPYWTLDIGGFFVKQGNMWFWDGDYEDGCNDLGYRELYTRWLQLGTFLPIFRSHGTDTRREIWNFGEKGETFYDTIHKFINLRYKLLPYIYSMAGMVTLENYTMMRLLPFDFINDKKTYNLKDQYMFGPSFMVCPVTEPMYYAPESKPLTNTLKTREVYLPESSSWYDYWTNKKFDGGQVITANADLEIMPIFVKEGSIIPMVKSALNCKESSETEFILNIYTGTDCKFKLYQDENNNYNYENGDYSTIDINWQNSNRKIVLEKREGSFNNMNKELTFKIMVNGIDKGEISYKGEEVSLKL